MKGIEKKGHFMCNNVFSEKLGSEIFDKGLKYSMEVSKVTIAIIDVPPSSNKNPNEKSKEIFVDPKGKSFWHIDKDTLPYKIHYFLMYGGLGAIIPFQIVIGITKMGLTAGNLAAAFTVQQLVLTVSNPGIGYLADYFNKLKAFLVGLTILQAILSLVLIVIPSVDVRSISQNRSHPSSIDTLSSNLCNNFQLINTIPTLQYSSDYEMRKVLSYFKRSNDSCIKCSKLNYFDLSINSYILDKISNIPATTQMAPIILDLHNESLTSMILMDVLVDGSRNFSLLCTTTEQFSILEGPISHDLLKKYCRNSDFENLNVKNNFDNIETEVAECRNSSEYLSSDDEFISAPAGSTNFKTYQFWLFTLCFISSSICMYSLFTLSDTACYESAQEVNYGRQIIWGAVSWGFVAPFAGYLNDYTQGYVTSYILFMIICCLQIWNLSGMHLVKPNSSDSILKDVKTVFKSTEFLAFEVGIFLNGFFSAMVLSYLTWFLMIIGGSKLVIGLVQTAECFLGEVPIMFISDWMIKKFGHFNLVSLAIFSYGIRFLCYSYIHNPWWIIPVEFFHGFSYGSFMPAMTSYAKLKAKPGTETTTQAILYITYKAFGSGLGCVAAGYFFDVLGAHKTFYYASMLCVLATFINVAFTLLFRSRRKSFDVTQYVTNKKF